MYFFKKIVNVLSYEQSKVSSEEKRVMLKLDTCLLKILMMLTVSTIKELMLN